MSRTPRAPLPGLRVGQHAPPADTAHYLVRVLRLGAGDSFVAFDPEARTEARATLVSVAPVMLEVGTVAPAAVVARRDVVLLQGLAKGDKVDAIVRDATELGATRIVLVETARSVVKLEGRKRDERRARLLKIAEEAARQCGRADPPEILGPASLDEAIALAPEGHRYALAPGATIRLGSELRVALATNDALVFAVGPEGGLAEDELVRLEASGFRRAAIGPFVLRTETVAASVLGAVRVFEAE